MSINIAKIYSTLGNPASRIPLIVKDLSATAGMTAGSYVTGKEEGRDRFIDEIGTEFIWLAGIPIFKWLFDKTIFKSFKFDNKFDARNLKNNDIFEKTKKYAPTEDIKNSIDKISGKKRLFKNLVIGRFISSTGLAIASYIMLTKFKQKYTEKQIEKNLINEYNKKSVEKNNDLKNKHEEFILSENKEVNNTQNHEQTPTFKANSLLESFVFNPVKNMYLLDGAITIDRLIDSRSPQELIGYSIKEASTLLFMYVLGDQIQKYLEENANNKKGKNISLDARILEDEKLKQLFESGEITNSLKEFEQIKSNPKFKNLKKDLTKEAVELYEFLIHNKDNAIVKMAKQAEIIKLHKPTGKIDTRYYIDLKKVEGVYNNVKELYGQYQKELKKGVKIDEFLSGVKKLKRNSIITNICACILALGVITPGLMLVKRLLAKEDVEFQTKKEIREKLIKDGIIS